MMPNDTRLAFVEQIHQQLLECETKSIQLPAGAESTQVFDEANAGKSANSTKDWNCEKQFVPSQTMKFASRIEKHNCVEDASKDM